MIRYLIQALAFVLLTPFTLLRWLVGKLRSRRFVLSLGLEGSHPHRPPPPNPFDRGRHGVARWPLRRQIRRLEGDARVEVVYLRIGSLGGGWAEVYELRQLIGQMKAPGREVIAWLPVPDTRTLWVASAADKVLLSPHVPVMSTGMALEVSYYGRLLSRLGLDLDVVSAGRFKSAMEPFVRRGPSDPARAALETLLDDLYGGLVSDLAAARGLSEDAVRAAIDAAPHEPEAVVELGLADEVVEEHTLEGRLGVDKEGERSEADLMDWPGPPSPWPRFRWRRPKLAVVEVRGTIQDGRHDDPNPSGAVPRAVCESLDRARRSKRIKGVLLHVDSRGGSATASEAMWQSVRKLAEEKPVVAWMGDFAASGGYYIPSAAHEIVAAPGTLTGSIGVIAAKPVAQRLLERIGVDVLRIERGEHATMFSPNRRFDAHERDAMEAHIARFYALFLQRAATGRGCAPEDIEPHAGGRVWTGRQALEKGLVDALGDEGLALQKLAARAGVPDKGPLLLIGPRKKGVARLLGALTTMQAERMGMGPMGALAASVVQPPWPQEELALLQLASREAVLAYCPVRTRSR